jgi:hypothetical protein
MVVRHRQVAPRGSTVELCLRKGVTRFVLSVEVSFEHTVTLVVDAIDISTIRILN